MFAYDVAVAFAGVTSRGLPAVLIKITSGSSHMLILGALKMMPTPLHAHGRWGKGVPSFVFDCVGGMCICAVWMCVVVCESVFLQKECNSCWGGGKDCRGELTLRRECGQCCVVMTRC